MIDRFLKWGWEAFCVVCMLVLLALATGCEREEFIVYCKYANGETAWYRESGRAPIKLHIWGVTTERGECWYSVDIDDDVHFQPRRFLIREKRLLK